MYLGTWEIDDLVTFSVNTHTPSTGAEVDADAVPDYRIFEDETGTPILTGSMALLDDANTVGYYSEQITLSAANGFEVGKTYSIRIRAVVGGVAASTLRSFQVELAPATAAALLVVDDFLDTEIGAIKAKTDNLPSDASYFNDTAIDVSGIKTVTDQFVFGTANRVNAQIYGIQAGAIAAASFAANALDAVWSTATRLLTAGTNIVLAKGTGLTGLNDLSAAQVNTEADTALADVGVTTTVTGRIDAAISSRSSHSAADVWASATRTLTSFGTLVADIATAVWGAATRTLSAFGFTVDTNANATETAIKAKTDLIPASPAAVGSAMALTSGERDSIAAALLDLAAGVETSLTLRQALRLLVAAEAGKLSGAATTTIVIRNFGDSKDRITATVDSSGNRSAVSYDLT